MNVTAVTAVGICGITSNLTMKDFATTAAQLKTLVVRIAKPRCRTTGLMTKEFVSNAKIVFTVVFL